MSEYLHQVNAGLAGIVEGILPSLVRIGSGRHGQGAGVVWRADGLILTNAHVARRGPLSVSLPDGRSLPARVVAHHPHHDLAFIQVEAADLHPARLADSRAVRPGQWVLALGHPWGVPGAATAGIVIGAGEAVADNPMPGRAWIAVSLHYRPGHSGGPLLDASGGVIGLNTVMAGPDVGLAVPVHVAADLLDALDGPPAAPPPLIV